MTASSFLLAVAVTVFGQTSNLTPLGSITDGLVTPTRLAAVPGGGLYVTDQMEGKVLQYDAAGALVGTFDVPQMPVGIGVVPGTGEVVVSRRDGVIAVYDAAFALLGTLDPAPMTMVAPNDIAVHPATGEIYVTDSGAHRVMVFDPVTRALVRAWGAEGSGLGQFQSPQAIAIDPVLGNVIVADVDNFRVQVFNTAGVLQFKFGYRTLYVGSTQLAWFARSEGLAVDACGNIYIADALMGTVRVYSKAGKELSAQFIPAVAYGTGAHQVRIPCDLMIDAGKLYVSSTANASVEEFQVACTAPAQLRGTAVKGKPGSVVLDPNDTLALTNAVYVDNPYDIIKAMSQSRYDGALDLNTDHQVNVQDLQMAVEYFGAATVADFLAMAGQRADAYPYDLQAPHMIANLPNLCGRCHSLNGSPGGMLTAAGQANLCISCHTPGGRAMGAPLAGVEDTNSHPWGVPASAAGVPGPAADSELALHLDAGNVRCATCHDPHESLTDGAYLRGSVRDGGLCAECHSEVAEWQHAGHSDEHGDAWTHYDWSLTNRAACRHCHSGNGFIDYSNGVAQNNRRGTFRVLDCVVCHATHGKPQDEELLRVYDDVLVPVNGPDVVLTGKGSSATCMVCHNGRYSPDEAGLTPHYLGGGAMLEGINGNTFGYAIANSPHTQLAGCATCHMAPSPASGPGAGKVGGHSFNVSVHDAADPDYGFSNVQNACNTPACHGATVRSPGLLITEVNRTAFGDYDGDGAIEGVQDEVQGLLDVVLPQILATGAVQLPSNPYWNVTAVPAAMRTTVEDAIWNWQFVKNSGDLGIHNTSYAVGLLQVTYRALAGQDLPGAMLRYSTPVARLPQTVIEIQSVNGGVPVQPGQAAFTVDFTVKDDAGNAIPKASLDRMRLYVAGPNTNYNLVITQDGTLANFVQNPDGSYTYTRPTAFPTVYAAPLNDSAAFGAADGELTGQPLQDGTYTVLLEARRSFGTIRKAGDAASDFVIAANVGAAPALAPIQLVTQEACNACHLDLQLHGGNRKTVAGCMVCHGTGSEDITTNPVSTPGVTIRFRDMIHKIHRSSSLPQVAATANSADPYLYEIAGFGGALVDFSDIGFPILPGGIAECDACHGGAADSSLIYAHVTRANCKSCHDDIDFTTGTILDKANPQVAGGLLTQAQLSDPAFRRWPDASDHTYANDSNCGFCHGPSGPFSVAAAHRFPSDLDEEGTQPEVEIVGVAGMTGGAGTYFQAGDRIAVTFKLKNVVNDPQQIISGNKAILDNLYAIVYGPTTQYQLVIPAARAWNNGALGTAAANWVDNFAVDGTYTFILPALPANYPAQLESVGAPPAEQIFAYEGGWGQLYTSAGTPLQAGTYTIAVYGRRLTPTAGEREPVLTDTVDVAVGAAGPLVPYAGTVTTAACNACHGVLAFHGNQRYGVETCLACHTAGTQDGGTYESVDLRIMVHKLHNAQHLTKQPYELAGHGGITDFSHLLISSMPGEAAECAVCHATDAWKNPPVRADMRTWMVACTSCHDSDETRAHVNATTKAGTFIETCASCHGDGTAWSVERVHVTP